MVTFFDIVLLRYGVINLEINWYVFMVCQQKKDHQLNRAMLY